MAGSNSAKSAEHRVKGYVQIYTPKAKEDIRKILLRYLEPSHVEYFTDYILTCLDELIKNGIKANYKFIYLRERIEEYLDKHPDYPDTRDEILKNAETLNGFVNQHIQSEGLIEKVREVLNDEARAIRVKSWVSQENRKYTDEEREMLVGLTELRRLKKLAETYDIRLQVSIYEDDKILIVDVVNSAPILQKDMLSINENRRKFKEAADKGEHHLFFLENIDESGGGAGLGYGTIDACLLGMGLDPEDTMKIIGLNNTTVVLSIEVAKLKEALGEQKLNDELT